MCLREPEPLWVPLTFVLAWNPSGPRRPYPSLQHAIVRRFAQPMVVGRWIRVREDTTKQGEESS